MKTLHTALAILLVIGLGTTTFAKQSLLDKAKEAAKNKKEAKLKKTKKGDDKMAIKGSGVPATSATKDAPPAPAAAATTK